MKRIIFALSFLSFIGSVQAQTIASKLATAWTAFENDPQMKSGIASLYVIDAGTGAEVFDRNAKIGLAPASTQKIITSATAYEILGKDYRYTTTFSSVGEIQKGHLSGSIIIHPSGDPTLGSWRWKQTSEDSVLTRVIRAIQKTGIRTVQSFVINTDFWEGETIPGGWIWADIGNYYGAGADALNWRENQYDLVLKSGKRLGDPVAIVGTRPTLYHYRLQSALTSAAKGTGDNAYIYFSPHAAEGIVRGTIPIEEDMFTISGAMPSGKKQFLATLNDSLSRRKITNAKPTESNDEAPVKQFHSNRLQPFHVETSPPLDSISYWFLKRSINLYGEALIKTVAAKQGKTATTDNGANEMQAFWSKKGIGIDASELNVYDGSGLSPLNRTTTHAQAMILQYAKKQPWFAGYYHGFPEYNSMKLKSGTINRVKAFSGYHRSKDGKEYIIAFIVNNYNGSASALVQKMYKVLDLLK